MSTLPGIPSWRVVGFDDAFDPISDEGKRIAQGDYQVSGTLPVVDQGEPLIGGYTENTAAHVSCDLPVLVFGDHTRRLKYIDFPFAVGAQGVKLLKATEAFSPRFLYYLLPTLDLPDRGYSRHYQFLRKLSFVMPPRPEQDRIVAAIEMLFTDLDASLAALKRVQANLRRYRASVLKAACEGRLVPTEAELARKEGRTYETGEQLLARLLKERRAKWEADQLAKMLRAGNPPEDDCWKSRYKELKTSTADSTPEVPEGWASTNIGQVAECLDGQRVPVNKLERAKRGGTIPYYGANGRVGWIDDFLFDEPLVLVVEDETFVGRTIPFSYLISRRSWVNNHAHVLRPTAAVLPEFLNYSLMFYPFTPLTTGSTGRRKLTQKALMSAAYLVPPLKEQRRIVDGIDRLSSVVEKMLTTSQSSQVRSDGLRQSILKRAFEGKLVPQDPNDEPASVLLERIRAERGSQTGDRNPRKQRLAALMAEK